MNNNDSTDILIKSLSTCLNLKRLTSIGVAHDLYNEAIFSLNDILATRNEECNEITNKILNKLNRGG